MTEPVINNTHHVMGRLPPLKLKNKLNLLMRIQTIQKLVVDEAVVPDAVSFYRLGGTYQFVQVVSRELASALLKSNLTGFSVQPIDEGEWLV